MRLSKLEVLAESLSRHVFPVSAKPLKHGGSHQTLSTCFNHTEIDLASYATYDPNVVHDRLYMSQVVDPKNPESEGKRPVVMGTMMEFYVLTKLKKDKLIPLGYNVTNIETKFKNFLFPYDRFFLDIKLLPCSEGQVGMADTLVYEVNMRSVEINEQQLANAPAKEEPDLLLKTKLTFSKSLPFQEAHIFNQGSSVHLPFKLDKLKDFSTAIHSRLSPISYALALTSGAIAERLKTDASLASLKDNSKFPLYLLHDIEVNPAMWMLDRSYHLFSGANLRFNIDSKSRKDLYTVTANAYFDTSGCENQNGVIFHLYTFTSKIGLADRDEITPKLKPPLSFSRQLADAFRLQRFFPR